MGGHIFKSQQPTSTRPSVTRNKSPKVKNVLELEVLLAITRNRQLQAPRGDQIIYELIFFNRVHATLQTAWSVGRWVGYTLLFL